MTFPTTRMCELRDFTYITLLSSLSILREYTIKAPTLDSQYNKRTQQTSVVTAVGELVDPCLNIPPINGTG